MIHRAADTRSMSLENRVVQVASQWEINRLRGLAGDERTAYIRRLAARYGLVRYL